MGAAFKQNYIHYSLTTDKISVVVVSANNKMFHFVQVSVIFAISGPLHRQR